MSEELQEIKEKNLIKETDSLKLLNAIIFQKNLKKVPAATWRVLCCFLFVIIPIIIFFFNKISIPSEYIRNLFSDLLTILSILIGFSITALSMVVLSLSKETLLLTNKYEGSFYKGTSIYKETIFVFLEYLYSLLASLLYIIIAQFIFPFVCGLIQYKFIISCVFFYTFIPLLYWNFLSIKSLIYNLYLAIMINTMAEINESNSKGTENEQ